MDVSPPSDSTDLNPDLNASWFLFGLFFAFIITSILCYLEIQSFQTSFDVDPVPRTGKEMRLVFLQVLLACNLSRAISLSIEIPLWSYGYCPSSWGCTLVHMIPNLPFLTAYSLLALFWAQLALSITNQHNSSLAPLFKKWNIILYSIFILITILAFVNALHRTAFIKAVVILLGFYYTTALILVFYFGFAIIYAFREDPNKRMSPSGSTSSSGSPMISYRSIDNNESNNNNNTIPNRTQNRSPLSATTTTHTAPLSQEKQPLASSSSSSSSSSSHSTPSEYNNTTLSSLHSSNNDKKAQTVKRLTVLCLFTGLIMLIHVLFFLGSFLQVIHLSFRILHKNETAVAIEYFILELFPTLIIMAILGSWKRRRGHNGGLHLTMPIHVMNGFGQGSLSREGSYSDLRNAHNKSNNRNDRSLSINNGGGGGAGGGGGGGGGGDSALRRPSGSSGFRNSFAPSKNGPQNNAVVERGQRNSNPNFNSQTRGGHGNRASGSGNGGNGGEFELRVPGALLPTYQQHQAPQQQQGQQQQNPSLHQAPQLIQPVARRLNQGGEEKGNSDSGERNHKQNNNPVLHHPQPTLPPIAI